MDLEEAKAWISKHPILRFGTILVTGFGAGIGLMSWWENHIGVSVITKAEERELREGLKKVTEEAQSLSQKNTQLTGSVTQFGGDLTSCRTERETLSRQAADMGAQLEAASKDKGECDAAKQEAAVSLARAQEITRLTGKVESQLAQIQRQTLRVKELEGESAAVKAKNSVVIKPGVPSVVSKARSVWTNELESYFDGALTVAVLSLHDGPPAVSSCVITNLDSQCRRARVGEVLPVTVGEKKYGIRIDKIERLTNESGKTTFTIMLLE